jgi:hypothetical protein
LDAMVPISARTHARAHARTHARNGVPSQP